MKSKAFGLGIALTSLLATASGAQAAPPASFHRVSSRVPPKAREK